MAYRRALSKTFYKPWNRVLSGPYFAPTGEVYPLSSVHSSQCRDVQTDCVTSGVEPVAPLAATLRALALGGFPADSPFRDEADVGADSKTQDHSQCCCNRCQCSGCDGIPGIAAYGEDACLGRRAHGWQQFPRKTILQCVQVSEQVVELLRGQLIPEARHLGPSQQDDVGYPIVVGGNAILHVGPLEQAIEAGTAQLALAVCKMTFRATCIVDAATVGLLHIQSQLGIGLSRFRVAGSKKQSCKQSNGEFENQGRGFTLQRYLPGLWELANCGQHETDAQSLRELEYTSR